jgi:hypothetical protein
MFSGTIRLAVVATAIIFAATSSVLALTREEARVRAEARARAAAAAPAPTAAGLDPLAPWQIRFDAMDANRDGRVTLDEARAHAEKAFKAMDKDGDGKLSPREFVAAHTPASVNGVIPPTAARATAEAKYTFSTLDTNHDGTLDLDEWKAAVDANFAKADVKKHGSIFRWEFRRFPW